MKLTTSPKDSKDQVINWFPNFTQIWHKASHIKLSAWQIHKPHKQRHGLYTTFGEKFRMNKNLDWDYMYFKVTMCKPTRKKKLLFKTSFRKRKSNLSLTQHAHFGRPSREVESGGNKNACDPPRLLPFLSQVNLSPKRREYAEPSF